MQDLEAAAAPKGTDQEALVEWLEKHGLQRLQRKMIDPEGDFGFLSLRDLAELSDADAQDLVGSLKMNLGESKRFLREQKQLRGGAPQEGGADAIVAKAEAPVKADEDEVEALRRQLQERDQELEERKRQQHALRLLEQEELKELEREHQAALDKVKKDALREQEERLKEVSRKEEEQRLLLQQELEEERTRRKLEEERLLAEQRRVERLQAAGQLFDETAESKFLEWFVVVKSRVFVKEKPERSSETLAILVQGLRVQVKGKRVRDLNGWDWVELTPRQLANSCRGRPPSGRGFVLIDGTPLGLGQLLEGPLERTEDPDLKDESEDPDHFQEQVKSAISAAVDIRESRIQRMRMYQEEVERARAQQLIFNWDKEVSRLESHWAKQEQIQSGQAPPGTTLYKSLRPTVFLKRSDDPRSPEVTEVPSAVGASFIATGSEYKGPLGGLWVELCRDDGWLLVEGGAGFKYEGPLAAPEEEVSNFVMINVNYQTPRKSICISKMFVSKQTTVRDLRQRLAKETQLKLKSIMLVSEPSAADVQASGRWNPSNVLRDHKTLESCGGDERDEMDLFLWYIGTTFEEDYRGGKLLQPTSA